MQKAKRKQPVKITRSPAYPFIPLGRALLRAEQLWWSAGDAAMEVGEARRHWGYGPSSSGGIQTEAALKQFALLDVSGRGEARKLKLSALALRLVGKTRIEPADRQKLLERVALAPTIHRELHEHWGRRLPVTEAQRFLIEQRDFNAKGARDVIAEYAKTMAHLELADPGVSSARELRQESKPTHGSANVSLDQLGTGLKENEIKVLVDGRYVSVSARVNRRGLNKLIKVLQANAALLGEDVDES